jgi:hypothetical protein
MKKTLSILVLIAMGLAAIFSAIIRITPVPLITSSSLMKFNLDGMINEANLIVIGEVKTNLPSKWRGNNGNDPKNASPEEVFEAQGLFTDSLVIVNQLLKGEIANPVVRIRTFVGETQKVRWINKSEPSYIVKKNYLLFLANDVGATSKIDPGDYVAVGAIQGVYEIVGDKAISRTDEWNLDELIAYIQNKLAEADSAVTPTETPVAPSATESPTSAPEETATSAP